MARISFEGFVQFSGNIRILSNGSQVSALKLGFKVFVNSTEIISSVDYVTSSRMTGTPTSNFSAYNGQTLTLIADDSNVSTSESVEWKPQSRTESIARDTDRIPRSDLLPSQSYTEYGRDGTALITWEEKYVNGRSIGEKRNESRVIQIHPVNNKEYVGTKSDIDSPTTSNGIQIRKLTVNAYNIILKWEGDPTGTLARSSHPYLIIGKNVFDLSNTSRLNYNSSGFSGMYISKTDALYSFLSQNGYNVNHGVELDVSNIVLSESSTASPSEPVRVQEWKPMSRTEAIEVTTREDIDPELEIGKTRTVHGTPGTRTYTWEELFIDGQSTGQKRNETSAITVQMVQAVLYRGTKRIPVEEWRPMSREEEIPITVRYENDPQLEKGRTRQVLGSAGIRTYTWEELFIDGVTSGQKRNENNSVTRNMVQTVHYTGTKETISPIEEWRPMTRNETIEVTTSREFDNQLDVGKSRTVQGSPGTRQYRWEELFRNNVSTGLRRNETNSITVQMVPTIIYEGTRPLPVAPPAPSGTWYKIGNLEKVGNGLFKGKFPLRDLAKVKFLAQGMIIRNVALYDGDGIDTWIRAQEDIDIELSKKADNSHTQERLNVLTEKALLYEAEVKAKASMEALSQLELAYNKFVSDNEEARSRSEQELIDAGRRIEMLVTEFGGLSEMKRFIDTYMKSSNEGLILGRIDGSSTIKISPNRISMFSGGREVMYISNGVIHIDNGIFTISVQIGRFRTEQHQDNPDINVIRYVIT